VSLPLAFWNGGRIGIGTNGQYTLPMVAALLFWQATD
jgi:hypothetical protein